jgi:hypothetical protein
MKRFDSLFRYVGVAALLVALGWLSYDYYQTRRKAREVHAYLAQYVTMRQVEGKSVPVTHADALYEIVKGVVEASKPGSAPQ